MTELPAVPTATLSRWWNSAELTDPYLAYLLETAFPAHVIEGGAQCRNSQGAFSIRHTFYISTDLAALVGVGGNTL